mgnify:CR=1 FL=1
MPKVIVLDDLSPEGLDLLASVPGIEYEVRTGLKGEELRKALQEFEGAICRSGVKITAESLEGSRRLKAIVRAGVGTDNIDKSAATRAGVVVMNTPAGNTLSTAEHTITLMLAMSRNVAPAYQSLCQGRWDRKNYMGSQVAGKTLGVVGLGRIGLAVAARAIALEMKVLGFDPFMTKERAQDLGIELVETVAAMLPKVDYLTVHTPLTEETRNLIDLPQLEVMKPGVRLINCARGGLVVEDALYDAIVSGKVAGAALDVFETEPATTHKLFGHENVVVTPHLGASTGEAQENVALQVAEQMADYLISGAVTNALNMPSISADEAPRLRPFVALAEKLGSFAGQLTDGPITGVVIEYAGDVGEMNTRALTSAALAGVLQPMLGTVNMVSAPIVARERGIKVDEVRQSQRGAYETYIRLTVRTENLERSVAGTVFSDGKPRIIQIKGIELEADFGPHMLYVTNLDKPGFIGALGMLLGNANVNIASFHLGRLAEGSDAICLVQLDEPIPPSVLAAVQKLTQVRQAKPLAF